MTLSQWLSTQKQTTDADFARTIKVSRQALARYKAGKRTPRPAILKRIKDATGGKVTANDFLAVAA